MKKIMFYTSGISLGGVEQVLLNILNILNEKKFDIKLGLQNENEKSFEDKIPKHIDYEYMLSQNEIDKILKVQKKKGNNIFYKIYYSFLMKKEKRIIRKNYLKFYNDRDVIIDFKNSEYAKLTTLENKNKKICWLHGGVEEFHEYKKNEEKFKKNLNKYDKIIVICDDMKDQVIKLFPELENKIEKIYNPFNIEKINKIASDDSYLSKLEKELLKEKYIVAVSRLEYDAKGYPILLKAFKLAKEQGLEEKLYIVGEGVDRKKIEIKVKELDLEDEVKLLGLQKNPYIWMKNAKLFVHASKNEGFGMVLVEAIICGIPVISTNCPVGPREILEDGKNGVLVEVGNSKEMALKLNELINNDKLREKYINNANKSIERFDSKKIKIQIEKILEEI